MSNDSFRVVTHESWFSRIGGAIKGVLVGGVLFVLAFPLLFWNEGRAVKTYKSLNEGAAAVVSVPADTVNPAYAGKLVHVSGPTTVADTLSDPVFGVSAQAVRLRRVTEMYQWKEESRRETEKKLGGGTETATTYTYTKVWAPSLIESARFKQPDGHANPKAMPYESSEWKAGTVRLGSFQLGGALVSQMGPYTDMTVDTNRLANGAGPAGYRVVDGNWYRGYNPASPQVGDVRVSFQKVDPSEISVVAQQNASALEPYVTKVGGSIALLRPGQQSADAMFQAAQANNTRLTWILRGVGFVVMFIGLALVLNPLSVLADVLPILGNIVSAGTGFIAFLVAAVLALVTVAVAWVVYRPLLGIGILLLAGAIGFVVTVRLRRSRPAVAVSEEEPLRRAA